MKKAVIGLLAGAVTAANCITAFAGEWKQDDKGWWYQNDDGTYYHDGWECIDANNDGVGEIYYFTEDGYLLTNTTTPDGSTVNENGARVYDGEIITHKFTKVTYDQIQDGSLIKIAGCNVDSLPVFTGLNHMLTNQVTRNDAWFTEATDKNMSYWWPETYRTGLHISAKDRNANESDADLQHSIQYSYNNYKSFLEQLTNVTVTESSTSEYNVGGRYWITYSNIQKGQLNNLKDHNIYRIYAGTFSPTKQYEILYTADLNRGGKKISPEDLINAIHITDDFSTIWLNADGEVTIETDAGDHQVYQFNFRK